MAKYNLKQIVKINKFDLYPTEYYYFIKKNIQPFRNLFRKKENRKYKEGWTSIYNFDDELIDISKIEKKYIIIDGKCFEKPEIRIYFSGNVVFQKFFETFEEVEKFEERIVHQSIQDVNYIIEL